MPHFPLACARKPSQTPTVAESLGFRARQLVFFSRPGYGVKTPYQNPVNISIPTKKGSKMSGEFTYPKMGSQIGVDNHGHLGIPEAKRIEGAFHRLHEDTHRDGEHGDSEDHLRTKPFRIEAKPSRAGHYQKGRPKSERTAGTRSSSREGRIRVSVFL